MPAAASVIMARARGKEGSDPDLMYPIGSRPVAAVAVRLDRGIQILSRWHDDTPFGGPFGRKTDSFFVKRNPDSFLVKWILSLILIKNSIRTNKNLGKRGHFAPSSGGSRQGVLGGLLGELCEERQLASFFKRNPASFLVKRSYL